MAIVKKQNKNKNKIESLQIKMSNMFQSHHTRFLFVIYVHSIQSSLLQWFRFVSEFEGFYFFFLE